VTREEPHRWRDVDALFQRALDRPASERRAFLEAKAAGRGDVIAAVERLLRSADRAAEFLETPLPQALGVRWSDLFLDAEPSGPDQAP